MTSPSPDTEAAPAAPLAMGRVALTVRDLGRVAAFYRDVVGLNPLREDGETAELGAGGATLLELRRDTGARQRSAREAGLFHTAFLLPTRADLGRWTRHAIDSRAPMAGASDHRVSEALYLSDPEGNGVEIYADRPAATWTRRDGSIEVTTEALDIGDLLASAGASAWTGFPEGASVGHVHLQVGAIAAAEAFYAGVLGLDVTSRYPGASFYAADGYHHHLATNIWNSRGAGPRSYPATGLAEVQIRLDPARLDAARRRAGADTATLTDPWGTAIALVPH